MYQPKCAVVQEQVLTYRMLKPWNWTYLYHIAHFQLFRCQGIYQS